MNKIHMEQMCQSSLKAAPQTMPDRLPVHTPFRIPTNCVNNQPFIQEDIMTEKRSIAADALWAGCRLLVMLAIMVSWPLAAQEKNTMTPAELARGITMEISAGDLNGGSNFLIISEVNGNELSLAEISLDTQKLLARVSKDAPPQVQVVHWFYDQDNDQLQVDIRRIKDLLANGGTLRVNVKPLNTRGKSVNLSAYQSSDVINAGQRNALPIVNEKNIEVKIDG